MELPQAFKCILLDSVDLVFMEAELDDIGRQVCRDLSQQVVGQVQQSEMIHVPEGLWVNLRDLVVDQKQALLWEKRIRVKCSRFKLSFAAFTVAAVRKEHFSCPSCSHYAPDFADVMISNPSKKKQQQMSN